MCVVALAWNPRGWGNEAEASRGPQLVVIANRDELHARPTAALDVLDEEALLVGGRDLEKGGGWLWACASGRLAAVTNVRAAAGQATTATSSRGELVATFATSHLAVGDYAQDLRARAARYGRFNLMLYDGQALGYATNVPEFRAHPLPPGVYALSNATLDTPWPKTTRVQEALRGWLASGASAGRDFEPLFAALRDDRPVPDADLPDTGVGLDLERILAPPFIRNPSYGTRCSSIVVFNDDELMFAERRFAPDGECTGDTVVTIPRGHRTVR